jgi:hypothetical protein
MIAPQILTNPVVITGFFYSYRNLKKHYRIDNQLIVNLTTLMKTKNLTLTEKPAEEITGKEMVSLNRAKEIMIEEGIEYADEELKEVLQFISKVVSITTAHYERRSEKQAKIISINTNTTHETKSIPLHPREYRRAS